MRKLPIGISDFREIVEDGYYFVDKSLMIRELLDSGSKSVLITRPRRFGKTLNLSMLRYFYERTAEDTSRLFRGLHIWREGEAYTEKQGRYPVIFLTFKDVKGGDWDKCYEQLTRVIRDELLRHEEALRAGGLRPIEEREYDALVNLAGSEVSYESSLKMLSGWLHRQYGEKTVILIDEYDTPIQQGYLHGYYDEVIGFMRNLLSGALKDNTSLEKGVLTGILRIAKESVFSGLNNLEVCTLIRQPYSARFGLTEDEVERTLIDCGVGAPAEEVKSWYNGYVFGRQTIYNPWSIVNYCANWQEGLQPYWVNTSGNELIRQLLTESDGESRRDLEQLIQGKTIRKAIDDHIVFREIEHSPSALWSFLLLSGYLKIVSRQWDDGLYGELQIPNREVAYLYRSIIQGWFERSIRNERYRMMLEALTDGEIPTFEAIFRDFVAKTFSLFDTGGDEPEKVYHAFVLRMLLGLRERYEVRSNRESGYGRYDVMLIPRDAAGRKGVVIEFKKAMRGETPEQAATAALKQIEEKRYDLELRDRGVCDIVKLGIAFAGKQVAMIAAE